MNWLWTRCTNLLDLPTKIRRVEASTSLFPFPFSHLLDFFAQAHGVFGSQHVPGFDD